MENKNIHGEFCELIGRYEQIICDLLDYLDQEIESYLDTSSDDLQEFVRGALKPSMNLKKTTECFKERLTLLMENWIKLQELKYGNE